MKFSAIALLTTLVASVSAHTTMRFPPTRGHPLNPNAAVKDFQCIAAPLNGGAGCAPKKFPCGGYPPDNNVVTTFHAGQVFNVSFFNQNFLNVKTDDPSRDQARHNGGQCELSLSYDGGKTYTVIATYHKTCPDIFFDGWAVKIPENAPSCDSHGDCLVSWSWINAVGNREFYQNCADVKIVGTATEPLPIIDITRANLAAAGFTEIFTPPGDPANTGNTKGSGPQEADVKANLALKIGSGGQGGKAPPKSPKNSPQAPPKTAPPTTPPKTAPKTAPTTPPKTAPTTPPKTAPKTAPKASPKATPATGAGSATPAPKRRNRISNAKLARHSKQPAACTNDGALTCTNPGKSGAFTSCEGGHLTKRNCPSGLICEQGAQQVNCTAPKRR